MRSARRRVCHVGGESVPELGWVAGHSTSHCSAKEMSFGYGMRGKFSERLGLWRWRDQTGGRLGNPQHHGVAVGDEDIAHTVRARASRDQRKTTPEEWMPRVCDFHFSQVVYQWVVDRGMKLFDPSMPSTHSSSSPSSGSACMITGFCA